MSNHSEILEMMKEPAFIEEKDALMNTVKEAHRLASMGVQDESILLLKRAIEKNQQSKYHFLIKQGIENAIADILNTKASSLAEQGKHKEADNVYDEAIKYTEEGCYEMNRCNIFSGAAANLMCLGEYNKCLALYIEISQIQQARHGPNHRAVLDAKANIAKAIDFLGDYETSLTLFNEILPALKRSVGVDDHLTLAAQANMAMTLLKVGNLQEAYDNIKEVCERKEKTLGPDDNQTLIVRGNLAKVLYKMGKLDEALKMFNETIEKRTKIVCADHPSIIALEIQKAAILQDQYEHLESLRLWYRILDEQKKVHGENHADTNSTKSHLEEYEQQLGQEKFSELIQQL